MALGLVLLLAAQVAQLSAPSEVMTGATVELSLQSAGRPLAGVSIRVAGPARRQGLVTLRSLAVRAKADAGAPVAATLYRNERVLVLEERPDGWCQVLTATGVSGFATCELFALEAYGQPVGVTDEDGRLSASIAVAPADVEVVAERYGAVLGRAFIHVRPLQYDRSELVAPGIVFREQRFVRGTAGPFTLQVLEVDPRHPAINILPVRAGDKAIGRETVSAMARRFGATAAVNGGYFLTTGPYAGGSSGVFLWNGEVVSGPTVAAPRTALLFCAEEGDVERLEFSRIAFHAAVASGTGATTAITGLHRPRGANDLVLYRTLMGRRTLTGPDGVESAVGGSGIVLKIEDGVGNLEIPAGGYVLSGTGAAADWLRAHARPGARLTLDLNLKQANTSNCRPTSMTGGGPRLLRDGKVELGGEGFAHESARHPRTAAGVTVDGKLLFVTLDGRQASSAGMTLQEFAETLLRLGAVQAMNLDGGGSTTMVVQDRIRNSPSDGTERPVSDAILIYSIPDGKALEALRDRLSTHGLEWAAKQLLVEAGRGVASPATSSSGARTP